jgi:hypothetical protein
MPESRSERELLAESLVLGLSDGRWAEFEASVLGRTATCPPTVKLIELGRNLLSPSECEEMMQHVRTCPYCDAWHQGFTRPTDGPRGDSLETMRDLLATPWEEALTSEPLMPASTANVPMDSPWSRFSFSSQSITITRMIGQEEMLLALPTLLEDVGLDPDHAKPFQGFLERKKEEMDSRFAAGNWPEWVEQYARQELGLKALPCRPRPEDWNSILWRFAVRCLEGTTLLNPSMGEAGVVSWSPSDLYRAMREEPMPSSWPLDDRYVQNLASRVGTKDVEARKLLGKAMKLHQKLTHRTSVR